MLALHPDLDVVIGIDTHNDTHTAAAVGATGAVLQHLTVPADPAGYRQLIAFGRRHGAKLWAIEGTGSFGAGLTTALHACCERVVEVDRPQRPARRGGVKSDDIDAVRAARQVLAGVGLSEPRRRGDREAIRVLLATRGQAITFRTRAISALHALVTSPPDRIGNGSGRCRWDSCCRPVPGCATPRDEAWKSLPPCWLCTPPRLAGDRLVSVSLEADLHLKLRLAFSCRVLMKVVRDMSEPAVHPPGLRPVAFEPVCEQVVDTHVAIVDVLEHDREVPAPAHRRRLIVWCAAEVDLGPRHLSETKISASTVAANSMSEASWGTPTDAALQGGAPSVLGSCLRLRRNPRGIPSSPPAASSSCCGSATACSPLWRRPRRLSDHLRNGTVDVRGRAPHGAGDFVDGTIYSAFQLARRPRAGRRSGR